MEEPAASRSAELAAAVAAVRDAIDREPAVGLIVGNGMEGLADAIEEPRPVPFAEIAQLPAVDATLIAGRLAGVPVLALRSAPHLYEGHSPWEVVLPVRVMGLLGASTVVITSAAGGLHPLWDAGDLVLIDDHINLLGANPLVGPNLDDLGPRFPDMTEPYDRGLQTAALEAALDARIPLRRGVYAAVPGPEPETRAEYRMLRTLGADLVGNGVVAEVIAARHMGLRVLGLAVVGQRRIPDALEPFDAGRVAAVAGSAVPRLREVMEGVLAGLPGHREPVAPGSSVRGRTE